MSTVTEKTADAPEEAAPQGATSAALSAFLEALPRIQGVRRVEWRGTTVWVLVPDLHTETADAVFDLEGDVRRAEPNSGLDVHVTHIDWG